MVIHSFKRVLLLICIIIVVMWFYSFILLHINKHNNFNDAYIMCEVLARSPNVQSLLLLGYLQDSIISTIIYESDSNNLSFLTTLSVPGREFRIGALVCKVAYYDSVLHSISLVDSSIIGLNDKLYVSMVMNRVAKFNFWKENDKEYYLCYNYYMPFWFKREIVLSTDEEQGINLQVSKVDDIMLSKILYYVNLPVLSLLNSEPGGANIERHIICGKLYAVNKEKVVYSYMPCNSILKDTIDGVKLIYIDLIPKDSLLFLYHFKGLFVIDDSLGYLIGIKDTTRETVFIPHRYMVNLKYSYNSLMKITRAIDLKYEVCTLYDVYNDSIYILLPLF